MDGIKKHGGVLYNTKPLVTQTLYYTIPTNTCAKHDLILSNLGKEVIIKSIV